MHFYSRVAKLIFIGFVCAASLAQEATSKSLRGGFID
jgi:hypothetical protein